VTSLDSSLPNPRERILDAASAVFAEAGFAGARIDEIASRAAVNKAMLYYHVGDKRALYTAVLTRNFDRVRAAVDDALTAAGPARGRLEAVITALTEVVQRHPDHPRIVLREIASGAANLPPEALGRMLEIVGVVHDVIEEGIAGGEFRRLDPVLTHLTIVGALVFLNATAPIRKRAAEFDLGFALPEPATDVAAFLKDMFLEGVAARGEEAES
jgi:TetR/AcrR family transcriptional regulator